MHNDQIKLLIRSFVDSTSEEPDISKTPSTAETPTTWPYVVLRSCIVVSNFLNLGAPLDEPFPSRFMADAWLWCSMFIFTDLLRLFYFSYSLTSYYLTFIKKSQK